MSIDEMGEGARIRAKARVRLPPSLHTDQNQFTTANGCETSEEEKRLKMDGEKKAGRSRAKKQR